MNLIFAVILALLGGLDGESAFEVPGLGHSSVDRSTAPSPSGPIRPTSISRRFEHRPGPSPGSLPHLDDIDTEEVDESWMIHLDILGSIPGIGMDWGRPLSSVVPPCSEGFDSTSLACFHLRC